MDGHAILLIHLVELIDAHQAVVRQDHGAALEREAAAVLHHGRREASGAAALAARVHRDRRHLVPELQELTLRRARVAQQQDVDVTWPP